MKRRYFLILPLFYSFVFAFKSNDGWSVIGDVQKHLYPDSPHFDAMLYLRLASRHRTFNDKAFLFDGLKKLQKLGYKVSLSSAQKEKLLREFSKSEFGENWISMLLNYTLEALFSDPIYGGNVKKFGWRSFGHNPGFPRPKNRYGKKDV